MKQKSTIYKIVDLILTSKKGIRHTVEQVDLTFDSSSN